MFKSMRNRLSQSGSRPSVLGGGSQENSLDLADRDTLDCDSDDPFDDSSFDRNRPPSRSATAERRKLRRLHSASSATTVDRIELSTAVANVDSTDGKDQQPLGLKQRAKNFLFRRRSLSSLDSAGQHRIDGKASVHIDPRLVSGYAAARRHHSDDCVLDAGHSGSRNPSHSSSQGTGSSSGAKKKQHKFSRSLNFFASMRRRSRSREAPRGGGASEGGASEGGASEGGWTDAGDASASSTLGRRGHRNSEQYMAPPVPQPQPQPQPQPLRRQVSSADALASNLNEISGLCLERRQLRCPVGDDRFANWPAVQLDGVAAWLGAGSSRSGKGKRHSVAIQGPSGVFSSGSLTRRRADVGGGVAAATSASAATATVEAGNLEAASIISRSTAEQLNLLCRQFNQAVTLRRSYRSKENLAAKLQRRSSGNWSGSSGSSGRTTAESKTFNKQLSNSTTASKDSALELKFEDDPHTGHRRLAALASSAAAAGPSGGTPGQFVGAGQHPHHQHHHHGIQPPHQQHQQQPQPPSPSHARSGWPVGQPQHPQPHHHHHQRHQQHQQRQQQPNGDHFNSQEGEAPVNSIPVPPRRSTSLRSGGGGIGGASASAAASGGASPIYLNQAALAMMLPTMTSSPSVTSPMTVPPSGAFRLDLISESPDESGGGGSGLTAQTPPTMPYRVQRAATPPQPAWPSAELHRLEQHQHQQHQQQQQADPQWQGAFPYPPPRMRAPLLTSTSTALTAGDSAARIMREARAKLSQLNRLSAELLAKKQLRPAQPPSACPFDALVAAEASAAPASEPVVANGNRAARSSAHSSSGDIDSSNWRNSLQLQDEMAVREYLKDLTAVCSTDYFE